MSYKEKAPREDPGYVGEITSFDYLGKAFKRAGEGGRGEGSLEFSP